MRWTGLRRSVNVEDRRGRGGMIGFGGPRMMAGGGIGTLILLVVIYFMGGNPLALFEGGEEYVATDEPAREVPADDEQGQFVTAILGSTEEVWSALFERMGREYREPRLVLFDVQTPSSCGYGSSAMGPFYCPADARVYIDLSFFDDLARRFQAPGDFAQAYVIAHEVGHHVQNQLGLTDRVHSQRGRVSQAAYNDLSVRLELQADFFAGVWAHHAERARQILEEGDVEEALTAASAIGDDRLQKRSQGYAVPDSFTHGTSAQRVKWFRKGLRTGDIDDGDTFAVREP
ncbi:MAG TPA: neutral zinc metallopeptidase [Phycisphaerae bacterium]|nr:neutral zinc metallopeptidase [Phycisphaerae bacterium]